MTTAVNWRDDLAGSLQKANEEFERVQLAAGRLKEEADTILTGLANARGFLKIAHHHVVNTGEACPRCEDGVLRGSHCRRCGWRGDPDE